MAHVAMDTDNPLGQRPFSVMGSYLGAVPMLGTPGDYDNNEPVLGALVSMGAITQSDMNAIFAGNASLDDMAVNMTMIQTALAMTGQAGPQTVQPLPTGAGTGGHLPQPTPPAVTSPSATASSGASWLDWIPTIPGVTPPKPGSGNLVAPLGIPALANPSAVATPPAAPVVPGISNAVLIGGIALVALALLSRR